MEVVDSRTEGRYTVTGMVEGSLVGIDVILVDLGLHGVQVRHSTPIKLGSGGKLQIRLADGDSPQFPAYVVWSRLAEKTGRSGDRSYHSGVRIEDPEDKMASVIGRLLNSTLARPDKESIEKKRRMIEERERSKQQPGVKFFGANVPRVPDDVILLVRQTHQRLQANPAENVRWLNRAKFSLDEMGAQIHHRDDVLAVWEYLERSVQLDIIARILDAT